MMENEVVFLEDGDFNQNDAVRENRANFLFFSIYLIVALFRGTNLDFLHWNTIAQVIQLCCLGVVLAVAMVECINSKIKPNPIAILFIIIGMLNLLATKHTLILSFAVFFFGFANFEFRDLLKKYLIVLSVTFLLIEILAFSNIIPMGYSARTDMVRYNMGFKTSTLASAILFFLVLGFVYLLQERIPVIVIVVFLAAAVVLYKLTDTRTGFYLTLLLLLIAFLYKFKPIRCFFNRLLQWKIIRIICVCFPVLILICDFALVGYYSTFTPLAFKLNSLLSTRLSLSLNLVRTYGFSLFGKIIPSTVDGEYYQSDICYLYYGLNYGILALVMTLYLHTRTIWYGLQKNDFWLVLSLLFVVFDGIFEPYVIDYKYQIFCMILSPYFLSYRTEFKVYACDDRLLEELQI